MIDISSLDFEITEAIRNEIMEIEPLLARHNIEEQRVKVTLSKPAPDLFRVQMKVHYLGEDIVSEHNSHNFHKALELCKDHFIKLADKRRSKMKH